MTLLRVSALLFILLLTPTVLRAATFEVLPQGRGDAGLATALQKASPGDSIILAPGAYNPPDRLSPAKNGMPDKPITIMAKQPGQSILEAKGNKFGLWMSGKSHIVVDGLVLKDFSGCGVKIIKSNNIVLKRLTVSGSTSQNISIVDSAYITVEDCEVFGSKSSGIYSAIKERPIEYARGSIFRGNNTHHNARSGILIYGYKNLIEKNNSHENGSQPPYDHGLYVRGKENSILGNECSDNPFGSGIRVGDRGHLLKDNRCLRNGRSGIVVAGADDSAHLAIVDNLLAENAHCGLELNSSKYTPFDIYVIGNLLSRNQANFCIKPRVSEVKLTSNVFSDPGMHQASIESLPRNMRFLDNHFYGPICDFFGDNRVVSAKEFFSYLQPGSTCAAEPYQEQGGADRALVGPGRGSPLPWPMD